MAESEVRGVMETPEPPTAEPTRTVRNVNLVILFTILLCGVAMLAVVVVAYFRLTQQFKPIEIGLAPKVESLSGQPQPLRVGDSAVAVYVVCNHSEHHVAGNVTIWMVLEEGPIQDDNIVFQKQGLVDAEACSARRREFTIPEVKAGNYRLLGTLLVIQGSSFQQEDFESEPFEVLSRE